MVILHALTDIDQYQAGHREEERPPPPGLAAKSIGLKGYP